MWVADAVMRKNKSLRKEHSRPQVEVQGYGSMIAEEKSSEK